MNQELGIHYTPDDSSFFIENKRFCEEISSEFSKRNIQITGVCSCWSYSVQAHFETNLLKCEFKFRKHKPRSYGIYEGLNLVISGIDKSKLVLFYESSLRRLFISREAKRIIPAPYFSKSNFILVDQEVEGFFKFIQKFEIFE